MVEHALLSWHAVTGGAAFLDFSLVEAASGRNNEAGSNAGEVAVFEDIDNGVNNHLSLFGILGFLHFDHLFGLVDLHGYAIGVLVDVLEDFEKEEVSEFALSSAVVHKFLKFHCCLSHRLDELLGLLGVGFIAIIHCWIKSRSTR